MKRLLRILRDRNFLLVAGASLGLLFGDAARASRPFIVPALAAAMTVSLVGVEQIDRTQWRAVGRTALVAMALTYVLHGGLKLVSARALGFQQELWAGFVLDAAVPCGVAVVPLSYTLGGDTLLALVGSFALYLSALAIMPLMVTALVGTSAVDPLRLLPVLMQLIIGPAIAARLLAATPLKVWVEKWRGAVVNWAFALLFFTVIGLNRDALLAEPQTVMRGALVGVLCSYGLSFVLERWLTRLAVDRGRRLTFILFGTIKNTSLAAATALSLFGERAALPAAIVSAVNVSYMVWLGVRWRQS